MMRWLWLVMVSCFLVSCEYEQIEREIGYKGKARMNPWLVMERYCQQTGRAIDSTQTWKPASKAQAMRVLPIASMDNDLDLNEGKSWVEQGGHLVLLLDHAMSSENDWGSSNGQCVVSPTMVSWLRTMDLEVDVKVEHLDQIDFNGRLFQVSMDSRLYEKSSMKRMGVVTRKLRNGQVTLVADARVFRNRYLSELQHAEVLESLVKSKKRGEIYLLRGDLEVSLWSMWFEYAKLLMVAIGVFLVIFVWRISVRKSVIQPMVEVNALRGMDYQLSALGRFYWQLDRAQSILVPLRMRVVELAQRQSSAEGLRDMDLAEYLASVSGLPAERLIRVLNDQSITNVEVLPQYVADLQILLQKLHPHSHHESKHP